MEDWTPKSEALLGNEFENSLGLNEFYSLIDNPDLLLSLLSDFLEQLQQLLPNYDQRALFLWTFEKTPRYYLELAYPDLKDPQSAGSHRSADSSEVWWEQYETFFGLNAISIPDLDADSEADTREKQQYTVYAYEDGSIGGRLRDLYLYVWEEFNNELREDLSVVFDEVPDFKHGFLDEAQRSLNEIDWALPDDLMVAESWDQVGYSAHTTLKAEYEISGTSLLTCYFQSAKWVAKSRDDYKQNSAKLDVDMSLFDLLDDLAPMLLLLQGLEYDLNIDQHSMEVKAL